MRLANVKLRNFRCYQDEISINFENITALIGKNECGKSSIMEALEIFFDDTAPDSDDASKGGNAKDVRIICEFEKLPSAIIIDSDYATTLKDEHLLNEHDRIEIHKIYDCSKKTKQKKPTKVIARAIHPTGENVDDLLTLKNTDLKKRASELGIDTSNIDNKINSLLRKTIWSQTSDLKRESSEIPLDVEAGKRILDQLKSHLPAFALFKSDRPSTDQDAEAQDPMKAAVKEAIKKKEAELSEISDFVDAQVKDIAKRTVEKIKEMDPRLGNQLNPRFSTPNWANCFKISLTGDEDIPINKRGSGVRRLILLNFFRAKAEKLASEKSTNNVIYAVEEPETSQHPNNQRMLMHAFEELVEQPNCQAIISTHTPMLGRMLPLKALRYLEIKESGFREVHSGDDETNNLVAKALGVLPDHDVKLFIGVEGIHDINFLKTVSGILNEADESIPDLQELEDNGSIIFIPLGGSNLIHWTSRLKGLNRPEFHLFDRDVPPPEKPPYKKYVEEINLRPECEAFLTNKKELENYLHPKAIKTVRDNVLLEYEDFDNVPMIAAKALHEDSESEKSWDDLIEEKRNKKISKAKSWLNNEAVAAMTPELLDKSDPKGEIKDWLKKISTMISETQT